MPNHYTPFPLPSLRQFIQDCEHHEDENNKVASNTTAGPREYLVNLIDSGDECVLVLFHIFVDFNDETFLIDHVLLDGLCSFPDLGN